MSNMNQNTNNYYSEENTKMKKLHDYDINNTLNAHYAVAQKKSPFSIFENERMIRNTNDNPHGILLADIHKKICVALSVHLVITSELLYRLFQSKGLTYEKKDIQRHLSKLERAGYLTTLGFESDTGSFSGKAYVLAGRGYSYLHSMGVCCKMGGFIAEQEVYGIKRLLSANQLIINGSYDNAKVAQVILIEPKNDKEKASSIFRPTATLFNSNGEANCFIECVRRSTDAEAELLDKLKRITKVFKKRKNANVPISKDASVILVGEDEMHMCSLINTTKKYRRNLNLLFTHDLETYSCGDDCLYEYCPNKHSVSLGESLAACL